LDRELSDYELATVLGDNGEVASFALESDAGAAVLKLSYSARGEASLRRGAASLLGLASADADDSAAPQIPRLLAGCFEPGRSWTVETRCGGINARTVIGRTRRAADLREPIAHAINALHDRTQARVSLSTKQIDELIRGVRFAGALSPSGEGDARHEAAVARLEAELRSALVASPVTTARVHGDLWVGNIMWDPARGAVAGIIDWEASHRGPPSVEMMHLILTTRAADDALEIGATTRRLLTDPDWSDGEVDLVRSAPGGRELSLRVALLLAWTRHVHANIRKSSRYARSPVWVGRNVHEVLAAI
jgi:aminoglycoside phosphotransferase (APT) family kinase protein